MNRIKNLNAIAKRGHHTAVLFAVILALATFANAEIHKAKKGSLKITATTEVGGIVLQPGDYEVKEINSASGPAVEFVHLFDNFTVGDSGLPVHNEEIVGQVKVTEQALSSAPKHTQLQVAANPAEAVALEIRGDDVSYQFASSQMADRATNCTNEGMQE
jgi:hypothetical protein